jgi:hypothetical protein
MAQKQKGVADAVIKAYNRRCLLSHKTSVF